MTLGGWSSVQVTWTFKRRYSFSTDGAFPENPAERDTSRVKSLYFDVTIQKLAGYLDDSVTYSIKGDAMFVEERECPTCPVEVNKRLVSITGDILTVKVQKEGYKARTFRKYKGAMRIVTFAQFLTLTGQGPE